jgi:hypothetical protein
LDDNADPVQNEIILSHMIDYEPMFMIACDTFRRRRRPTTTWPRHWIDRRITTKGNLDLGLLRDGTPDEVISATCQMVEDVRGFPHIFSTADAVLPNTRAENYIAFVRTTRELAPPVFQLLRSHDLVVDRLNQFVVEEDVGFI